MEATGAIPLPTYVVAMFPLDLLSISFVTSYQDRKGQATKRLSEQPPIASHSFFHRAPRPKTPIGVVVANHYSLLFSSDKSSTRGSPIVAISLPPPVEPLMSFIHNSHIRSNEDQVPEVLLCQRHTLLPFFFFLVRQMNHQRHSFLD